MYCPSSVKLVRVYETQRSIKIMLEYCDGGNLGKYIRNKHLFSLIDAKVLAAQLLLTIDLMEKLNIIHRDIKPENILLSTSEEGRFTIGESKKIRVDLFDVKLADYGYAIYLPPKKESD